MSNNNKVIVVVIIIVVVVVLLLQQIHNNNNNNNCNCNCKTKIYCPMNGICNLKNVVYQATIFLKENVKDKKKVFWNFVG